MTKMKKIFNIKIKNNSSKPKKKDQTCDPSYEKMISHKQQIKKKQKLVPKTFIVEVRK
jgi:hypothetical protein